MRDEATDISKSPERIAGMFDAIAGRYDFLNHVLSAGIDTIWRKRAVRSLQLTGRERVLDLCAGTGNVERIEAAFREMRRVLTAGGRIAILEFAVPTAPGFSTCYRWYITRIL